MFGFIIGSILFFGLCFCIILLVSYFLEWYVYGDGHRYEGDDDD